MHISSGVSALICALLLGKRLGLRQRADAAAQPDLHRPRRRDAVGRLVRLQRRQRPGRRRPGRQRLRRHAFRRRGRRADLGRAWNGSPAASRRVLGACSGVVAGLVCITPASGFVTPMPALLMGVAAGVVCFLACTALKSQFGYDDSLDAFGVHGVGGTLGAILTGVFATRADRGLRRRQAARPARRRHAADGPNRRRGRSPGCLAIVATFVILKVLDADDGPARLARGRDRGPRPQPARRRRLHLHLRRSAARS